MSEGRRLVVGLIGRRAATLRYGLAVLSLVVAAGGCSGSSGGLASSPSVTASVGSPASGETARAGLRVAQFCMLSQPPAALARRIRQGRVRHWPPGVAGVDGVLPDGVLVVGGSSGTELMRPGSGIATRLYAFPDPGKDLSLSYEYAATRRYVVYRIRTSSTDGALWFMVAVDRVTGRSRVIGRANPGLRDDLLSIIPVAHGRYAAWSQARRDGSLETHVVDLRTGRNRTIPFRNVAFPQIVGHTVVAVAHPSGDWHSATGYPPVAFDARTLARVAVPGPLRVVDEMRTAAISPAGVIWGREDLRTIHAVAASRPGLLWQAGHAGSIDSHEEWPQLSDNGFAGWYQHSGGPKSGVFADVSTGASVVLGNRVYIGGDTAVVETFPGGDRTITSVFSTRGLPRLTGCRPKVHKQRHPVATPSPTLSPLNPARPA